ncbi:MAG: tripartite tricarboxylate transporter TctB family protein [Bacillota bacterium]|uniref:tripartite tricarboxylate transporter TctB family protein n=1 Tax=Bacillus infantis TaxID=324767 RepID=UPI0039823B8D
MKSLTANIFGCGVFLLIGVWFLVNSLFLPGTQNPMDVGPAAFPILSAVGLIVASTLYLVMVIRKKRESGGKRITISNQMKVFISMAILIAYIFTIQYAGYYIASILFIPLFLFNVGVKRIVNLVPVSAGFILFVYVLFDVLLEVPLP